MRRYLPFAIIAAVLLVALGAGFWMLRSTRPQTSTTLPSGADSSSAPTPGSGRATVTLVEFGDYQCPPCGNLHPEIKKIKAEYGERLRFVFHHLPLTSIHKNALAASLAATAAGLQNRFVEMHNLLYENQSAWSEEADPRPIFISYARRIGLDVDRFLRDLGGDKAKSLVASDLQVAQSLGVDSTPTLFINGRLVPNESISGEGLRREINRALGVASAPSRDSFTDLSERTAPRPPRP